jgi:hypothetical protein
MTFSKTLLSALGLTVALAFSAPMFTATSANAAGATTTEHMKKPTHHKKSTHKKHKKTAPKKVNSAS